MYRIILIDDEPLILAGIASLNPLGRLRLHHNRKINHSHRSQADDFRDAAGHRNYRHPDACLKWSGACRILQKRRRCFFFYCADQLRGIQPGKKSHVSGSHRLSGKAELKTGRTDRHPESGQKEAAI